MCMLLFIELRTGHSALITCNFKCNSTQQKSDWLKAFCYVTSLRAMLQEADTRCNCCVKCCRSRTHFYPCHIACNIALNNCIGGHTAQLSDCVQYCIVRPVLQSFLKKSPVSFGIFFLKFVCGSGNKDGFLSKKLLTHFREIEVTIFHQSCDSQALPRISQKLPIPLNF